MKTRRLRLLTVVICALAVGGTELRAQSSVEDPIARSLFEPDLIMRHRRTINLTDEQRDAISKLIKELQGQVVALQWDLKEQTEDLTSELNRARVDLDRAQDRMGKVLQTERRIKEAHLTLLVRIKNVLKPEQQESLRKLRTEPPAGSPES